MQIAGCMCIAIYRCYVTMKLCWAEMKCVFQDIQCHLVVACFVISAADLSCAYLVAMGWEYQILGYLGLTVTSLQV